MRTFVPPQVLDTSAGQLSLQEYRLRLAGHEWAVLHTGRVHIDEEDRRLSAESRDRLPWTVALRPASIALAQEVRARAAAFRGCSVLELGAGPGLPGIVAASFGAQVVQTDRHELAISVCQRNAARNEIETIGYRVADWTDWRETDRYEWIIGSDVLDGEAMHPHLRRILESNLARGGRVLISDPFREVSLRLVGALDRDGWRTTMTKWNVGEENAPRPIGVFELAPPIAA